MVELLKSTKLFEGIDESIVKKIAAFSKLEKHKANTSIVEEDDDDNHDLFIVLKGRVRIFVSSKFLSRDNEDAQAIYTVNPGDFFGEMSCIVKKRRSASASTMTNCEIIRISGHKFTDLIESDNKIGFALLKKLYEALYDRIQNSNFMLRNFLI